MDDRRFDSLVKALAEGKSRRTVLKGLLGLGGAALAGSVALEGDSEAARRPSATPTPRPVCPSGQSWIGGTCQCTAAGTTKCGPACCNPTGSGPAHSECCDNECCFGTCYGEELCCPTNTRAGELSPTHRICDTVNGRECCPAEQECCAVDGCCDGGCYGGTTGRDFCCPASDFCPSADGLSNRCCADGSICCAGGTDDNGCAECCSDADCPAIDACTTNRCQNNQCVAAPITCDDGNACTTDTCDPQRGCIYTPITCDDNNACTIDTCDPQRGCVYTVVDCDDGNACTVDTCDSVLGCIHTPVICDDNSLCTTDTCDPQRGCVYTVIDCDDGDPCTIDSCRADVGCVHTPIDCSGLNNPALCLIGVCSGGTCTTQSTCAAGTNCCGDGTCSASCVACTEDGDLCESSSECCEGCCVANLPNFEDWVKVCTDAGLIGTAAVDCAQLIIAGNYALTCFNPPVIHLGTFPNNPVTLPCAS